MNLKVTYSHLVSLRNNLGNSSRIEEKYIHNYNSIINNLEKIGYKGLESFMINIELLHHDISSIKPDIPGIQKGKTNYTKKRYINSIDFFTKIDALINFFQIGSEDVKIGFNIN